MWLKINRGQTYQCLFENGDFSFSRLAYRPHLSGENCHRKRTFSKTLSREEIFGNAGLYIVAKAQVFEYDDVVHHILEVFRMLCKACNRISIVLAFSYGENTLLVDAYFFENGGIKFPYLRISGFFGNG